MGYDYTVISVVCWVELPEQSRLCPIFVKIWIPINGTQQCGIGSPKIHRNSMGLRVVNETPGFEVSHNPHHLPVSWTITSLAYDFHKSFHSTYHANIYQHSHSTCHSMIKQ